MKNHTVKFLISAAFLLLLPFLLCGKDVFLLKDGKAVIDFTQCVGCNVCRQLCKFDAIEG